MPDILICPLVAAETYTSAEQALSAPRVTGHHEELTDLHGFDAVHFHFHQAVYVGFQDLLQQVVFLILDNNQIGLQIRGGATDLQAQAAYLQIAETSNLQVFCCQETEWSQKKSPGQPFLQGNLAEPIQGKSVGLGELEQKILWTEILKPKKNPN